MSSLEEVEPFAFLEPQLLKQQHFPGEFPLTTPLGTSSFLYFTLLFWNQIFTCFSDKRKQVAISIRLSLDRYILEANSLSNSNNCLLVKAVLIRLLDASCLGDGGVGLDSLLSRFGEVRGLLCVGEEGWNAVSGGVKGSGCIALGMGRTGVLCGVEKYGELCTASCCCCARPNENR